MRPCQESKGGEEKVRQRKELADCGKAVLEDGCLKDTQPDLIIVSCFGLFFSYISTFSFASQLSFFVFFFSDACTSLEGLINESTRQQPPNTPGIRAQEKNYL